jgi:hypothetical protein
MLVAEQLFCYKMNQHNRHEPQIMINSKSVGAFKPLDEITGVYVANKGGLRCSAFKLTDGSLCLFSPVLGLGDEALQSIKSIGTVSHLIAPNHYHNAGLAEYAKAFPAAKLNASPEAASRLAKVTGLNFEDLHNLKKVLPKSFSILEPKGLKTGEVWISSIGKLLKAWFVVDAIAGPKMSGKIERFDHPELLKTFPTYGVRDFAVYSGWFLEQLKADQPRLVVPCHGGLIAADNLPVTLRELHQKTFFE